MIKHSSRFYRPVRSLKAATSTLERGWAKLRSALARKPCYDSIARRREPRPMRIIKYALDFILGRPPCLLPPYHPEFLTLGPAPVFLALPAAPILLTIGAAPSVISGLLVPSAVGVLPTLGPVAAEAIVQDSLAAGNIVGIILAALSAVFLAASTIKLVSKGPPAIPDVLFNDNGDYPDSGSGGERAIYRFADILGTGLDAGVSGDSGPPDEDRVVRVDLGNTPLPSLPLSFAVTMISIAMQLFMGLSTDGLLDATSYLGSILSSFAGFSLGIVFEAANTFFSFVRSIQDTLASWTRYANLAFALRLNPSTVDTMRSSLLAFFQQMVAYSHTLHTSDTSTDHDGEPGLGASMWAPGPDDLPVLDPRVVEPVHIILDADTQPSVDEAGDDEPGLGASMWAPAGDDEPGLGSSMWARADDEAPGLGASMWAPQPGEARPSNTRRRKPVHIFID